MRTCLSFGLVLICTFLYGQGIAVTPIHHEWNAFITQDTKNQTWISSLKYWNVYDGNEVKPFGDPAKAELGGYIQSDLFEDKTGKLWYSTENGIYFLDQVKEEIKAVALPKHLEGSFFAFHLDGERRELWFADKNHIWTYNLESGELDRLPFENHSVRFGVSLFPDGSPRAIGGALYSGGNGFELLTRAEPGSEWAYQWILQSDGQPFSYVRSLVFASNSILYLGTDKGLFSYQLDNGKTTRVTEGTIHDLSIHNDGKWLTCSVLGESIITYLLGETGAILGVESKFSRSNTYEIYHDPDQRLWENHPGEGVSYIPNKTELFKTDFPKLNGHKLADLHRTPSGHVYSLSTEGTVFLLDEESNSWEKVYNASAGINFACLSSDSRSLYMHSTKTMVQLKQTPSGNLIDPQRSLSTKLFQQLAHHEDNSSIVLDFKSVYPFDKQNLSWTEPALPYFIGFPAFSFDYLKYLGNGDLMLDHDSREVMFMHWEGGTVSLEKSIPVAGDITCIARSWSKDSFFLGTNNGLYAFGRGGSISTNVIPSLSGTIKSISVEAGGKLILGTDEGLIIYNSGNQEYRKYLKEDGLPDNNFIRDATVISKNNEVWMLTTGGLLNFNLGELPTVSYSYEPKVDDIWLNNMLYQDSFSSSFIEQLDLSYQENTLNFKLSNTGYEQVGRSTVDYRLTGYDPEWISIDNGGYARFTKIPPGNYGFEFRAKDAYGNISGQRMVRVTISPPFYKTWWFWTLCGTALLGLFYYFNRRAVQREKARQEAIRKEDARKAAETLKRHQAVVREQRRIMMELHDDLGGTLGSLFYTLDGYLLDQVSGLPVTPDFELLKNTSGDAMKQLREVMKNNVAREMSLPVFMRTLAEQARAVAANSRLDWELEKDGNFPGLQLSSQQVHNALLVFKEALQNVRKHAKATSFILKFQLEEEPDNILAITLVDNGVGIGDVSTDHREDGTGHGFRNMQRRAEDLEGILTISSPEDGGTCLRLSFPLG